MRADAFVHAREDVYVSPAQIRRCELRPGDEVTGPVRLIDAEGNVFDVDEGPIALCRCGLSKTKPFCDRSHRENGFESCPRAQARS